MTSEYIYIGMMFFGLFFVLTAGVGIMRMPDLYIRLHAASKATTFGFAFIVTGAALLTGDPTNLAKAFIALIFQFVTTPIAAHMVARVALRRGIVPIGDSNRNLMQPVRLPGEGERAGK